MQIKQTSVYVDDQDKALKFYTEVLGFVKKADFRAGHIRWLTVASPENDDIELLLELNNNPAAKKFQETVYKQGLSLATFAVEDIHAAYERMRNQGVLFRRPPTVTHCTTAAIFEDSCGNLIQLVQR